MGVGHRYCARCQLDTLHDAQGCQHCGAHPSAEAKARDLAEQAAPEIPWTANERTTVGREET